MFMLKVWGRMKWVLMRSKGGGGRGAGAWPCTPQLTMARGHSQQQEARNSSVDKLN